MDKYIPDIYQQSVYTIDYKKLINRGIKCVLFDLDNTLAPASIKNANEKMQSLFKELKELGLNVCIFSNSPKSRVKVFADELGVKYYASTCKPLSKNFKKVMFENDYQESEVAIVGDQLLTDVLGGNKVGITTILINPISPKDSIFTKFNRMIEKRLMKKFLKYDLFILGKYYD